LRALRRVSYKRYGARSAKVASEYPAYSIDILDFEQRDSLAVGGAPVTDYQDVTAKMSEALTTAGQCSKAETVENYSLLGEQLNELGSAAGRALRSHIEYQPLLTKLQQDTPLTAEELRALKSLVVGDADQYLKYDDDFQQYKSELGTILDEIRQLKSGDFNLQTLMHLRVLCREASSALAPTIHYLEQKERVRNFEEHTRGPLSSNAKLLLADIIKHMAD
jgi:hypothetical protein